MAKRFRLVSKKPNARTGRKHVSSSSDGIVDVAAAVERGLAQRVGIVQLLPAEIYSKARRLLENNELVEVDEKRTPRPHLYQQRVRRAAKQALPTVIGPLYLEAFEHDLPRALSAKCLTDWIRAELTTPGSALNRALTEAGFDDLVELQRSDRWWLDSLELRSKFAE